MAIRSNGIQPIRMDRSMMLRTAMDSPGIQPPPLHVPDEPSSIRVPNVASPPSIAYPSTRTAPAHFLGDVAQFNQAWTHVSQRRNEASQRLINSFDWDGSVVVNQGLSVVDRQRIVPGEKNVSSMDVCLESFSHQGSVDTQPFMDQWSDDLDDLARQSSAAQPGLVDGPHRNMYGYLDESLHPSQNGHGWHFTSQAPSPEQYQCTSSFSEQPSLEVELALYRMVESLDALYQRITMGLDVSGCGRGVPSSTDKNPQPPQNNDANADMRQERPSQFSFMCPYAMRYPDRVNYNCFQRLNTIPYVKQHLRHSHHDAFSCPHRCQNRKAGASNRRSRPDAALCYDTNTCLQINKQRSDRSKTHKQQWERIYQILFPDANRILDPYIGDLTVRRLRGVFKFMENHGSECLAAVYDHLPRNFGFVYPEPEVMNRIAFCTWLPRVFEQRFPPHGQLLLGGFLNQIESVLRNNSYTPAYTPGLVSREKSASLLLRHQVEQQGTSLTSTPHLGTMVNHQPHHPAVPPAYPTEQPSPFQAVMESPLFEPHHDYSSFHEPYFSPVNQPQTDVKCSTPTPGVQDSEYEFFDSQDFLFDKCGPMLGSPSQFFTDAAMNMEDIDISQTSIEEFDFDLNM
ncbi:hypothetical protein V8C37DRAFT_389309 [Trichoderma ceciliae]